MNYIERAKSFRILRSFVLLTLAFTLAGAAIPAQAQTFTVIHDFLGAPNEPSFPATLVSVLGRDGDVYSQSYSGGTGNNGTIFKATPSGTITVLRNNEAGCKPNWLSMGSDGNLYGACESTAASPNGYIWQLTPGGTFTDLHDFNGSGDGASPLAPFLASDGNLYGVTYQGGANNLGTFYKRSPSGTLTTLHTFDSGNNGNTPQCIPTPGANGNFYCTTTSGGANGDGTAFSVSSAGKFSLLHTFAGGASDGVLPSAGLILATDGNFYGTTLAGGASNQGTVFKMTASGTVTLLHSFNGTTDGGYPANGVTQASDGNLYGAANDCNGGCGTNWTAFKVTRTGVFTVLHTFNGGSDGRLPDGGMVQLTNGIFYGVCEQGGNGNGTLWTINTGLKPFLSVTPTSGKVGTKVGIMGQGFSSSSVVKFGGMQATSVTLTGTTYIVATVPAGAVDGKVTVTTGSTTLTSTQTFIVHNSWSSGKAMPTAVDFPAGTGVISGKIYVVGGNTKAGVVANNQVYNTATNTWTTSAALPTATYAAASAVVANVLYVFGGTSNGTTATNAVWAYSPISNTWTAKAAMLTARFSTAAVVKNNIIYVIGGNGSALRLNTVESYNPATNTWTTEAPLLVGKSEPSAGLVGTTIVAADGYTASKDTGDNEAYNTSTNTWSALAADPTLRNGACYGSISGQLYVAGGWDNNAPPLDVTNSFSLTAKKWTTQAVPLHAVTVPASAVNGGLLYCIGGTDGTNVFDYVQIYQP